MFPIYEVTDPELAFGGRDLNKLMPAMQDIPRDYPDRHKWTRFFSQVFTNGAPKGTKMFPREGVDTGKALRHLRAIMVSYQPKHEHKEAACAYLLSQWFTGWEDPKPEPTPDEKEWQDWYEKKVAKPEAEGG